MSKAYYDATVDVSMNGKNVKYSSPQFDKHNHIHMAPDKDNKPDVITFNAAAGYVISSILFDLDGPFQIITQLPAASAVVHDHNNGAELKKYGFTVTLEDESGKKFTGSDPKIVNDPGNM